jgi:hypothetical protein
MTFFGRAPRRLRLSPPGSVPPVGTAPVTLQAEVNRGLNFYAVASLVVSATSMLPGLWAARGWASAVDDVILAGIAAIAAGWYLHGRNRLRRSPVPLVLLTFGLVAKLVVMLVAYKSGAAASGDATAAAFLGLTISVMIWQLVATRRPAGRAGGRIMDDDLLVEALRQRAGFQRRPKS